VRWRIRSRALRCPVEIDGSDAQGITVLVSNRGKIPPERMPTLFEPFQRASREQGGFGLGLYIAKQFVEAHGGRIGVR
jgi:two-component system, sensor histidine kinase and response regulator